VLACAVCLGAALLHVVYPLRYRNEIVAAAEDFSLPPSLVCAVALAETRFDATAVSRKGAVGLMQLLPSTAAWMAEREGWSEYSLQNASDNIRLACAYLAYLTEKYGSTPTVLAAYNAGEGRVDDWLKDDRYAKGGRLVAIPFAETAHYCKKALRAQKYYRAIYGLR